MARRQDDAAVQPDDSGPGALLRRLRARCPIDAVDIVMPLAQWSPWHALIDAALRAPRVPGVYLARRGSNGELLYVGHAGERAASQPGLRGRLGIYARGRGAVSGLGEAALDRALADRIFVRQRLELLELGYEERAKDWARAALSWANVHVSWTTTEDKASAMALEKQVLEALQDHVLWNRLRPRPLAGPAPADQ